MRTVEDLEVGDELILYMRLGLALETGRRPDGTAYRYVPGKPQRARSGALTRCMATVRENDTDAKILTVNTVGINSWRRPMSSSPNLPAEIHYSSLQKVLLISPEAFEPRDEDRSGGLEARPTTSGIGTNFKPYHTLENILILP